MKYKFLRQVVMVSRYLFTGIIIQTCMGSILLAHNDGFAQKSIEDVFVGINVDEKKLITIFNLIESKTDFEFVYKVQDIRGEKKITLHFANESLGNILRDISRQSNLNFKRINNRITVKKGERGSLRVKEEIVQEDIEISGVVTDENGDGLPGAAVLVSGTTEGTITDASGAFKLQAPENATLVFSFLGYQTQQIEVGGRAVINVTMILDFSELEEIVVVGYGTQKKSDVTGSVVSVPKERLENLPVTDLSQAIQGTTAGLNITQGSSVPGSTGGLQVRGLNSINAGTEPFIVVDGVPFFGTLNDIGIRDVASIEILKDASAVAIYGTRGSNGVILITTKRGSSEKPTITYNVYTGVENLVNTFGPADADSYLVKYADFLEQSGLPQNQILPNDFEVDNYNAGITTDWMDVVTQTGNIQEHNLSLRGGTEKSSYFISGAYLNQKGVLRGYEFKKVNLRANFDLEVTDYLKIGVSSFFANNNTDGGRVNFVHANAMSPYSKPFDDNGNYEIFPMFPEQLYTNPLLGLTTDRIDRNRNFSGNAYADLTPGFIKGFKYRINASYTHRPRRFANYSGREANNLVGTARLENDTRDDWVIENILSYSKDIEKHHFDVTALYSAQENRFFTNGVVAQGFVNDQLSFNNVEAAENISAFSGSWRTNLLSQMIRVNYSYDSKYLVTVTARRDGFSAFGRDTDKYGVFPSLALGWNMHNESFLSQNEIIDMLKLRLSHGKTGNQAVDPNQTVTTNKTVSYPFGGTPLIGAVLGRPGNSALNWETTTSTNIGMDFGLLQGRIDGSIEVYRSKTKDILLRRGVPEITGTSDIWANLGEMQNTGLEFTLRTVNIDRNNFKWETNLNFSTFDNEILEIYGDGVDDIGNRWFIGKSLNAVFDYRMIGVWQEGEDPAGADPTAQPGDLKFEDINEDGIIDAENDRVYLGSTLPSWTGGVTNRFTYKNFTLSIFVQTTQGVLKNNAAIDLGEQLGRRNIPADVGYWTPENRSNEWSSLTYFNTRNYRFPRDASYVRIRDITFSYNIPNSVLDKYSINRLMVFVTGRNLATFTDWTGWDPENNQIARGAENFELNYPLVRTFSVGLNLTL